MPWVTAFTGTTVAGSLLKKIRSKPQQHHVGAKSLFQNA
jgi:hypothetical protein